MMDLPRTPAFPADEATTDGRSDRLELTFQRVARAKEEWEAAVDAVGDLVLLTDTEGRVVRCNIPARDALGRPFQQILGRPLEELLHHLGCRDFHFEAEGGEHRTPRDGRTLQYSRFPASCYGRSFGFVFVFRDVTELRHLQTVAARVDMMNNLGHVLACVRHEIGNPANAMKTALTVMAESLGEFSEEKVRSYIHRCLDDVQRIQVLLDQLRTLNVFEVSCQERVDLRAFVADHLPAMREGLQAQGVELDAAVSAEGDFEAACDPRAVYHILLGLLTNASEALAELPGPRRVRVALGSWSGYVSLEVTDNGPGIDPVALDKVVLPLYTTKPRGTGLGLAIAHEMVTRMGGSLEIGNDVGLGGARLTIHLPASTPAAPH